MSRMAAAVILMLSAGGGLSGPAPAEEPMARYQRLTQAVVNCRADRSADEIVVCARRDADRYRVPLIIPEAGDPRHEGVELERVRLQAQTTPCQNYDYFLVGCKGVGVSVSTRLNGQKIALRPLAP